MTGIARRPVDAGQSVLTLVAAERRTFAGPARYLDEPANRADLARYLTDLTGDTAVLPVAEDAGQSYGEMAEALIAAVLPDDRPVGLLVLAYSVHDLQPGRATATYLSSVCPGTPLSFAICDQGSAAAFTGLRIARDYRPDRAGAGRVLLIVLEQAGLPYPTTAARPGQHRGVALLFEHRQVARELIGPETIGHEPAADGPAGSEPAATDGSARLVGLRQRSGLAAAEVAGQASADLTGLADLAAGRVRVLASPALAAKWADQAGVELRTGPADQPATGLWWQLLDELPAGPELLVAADYDPELGTLSLAAFTR